MTRLSRQSHRSRTVVDLTLQHKNHTLLVEGPEIMIRPVGVRQWSMRERFCAEELQAMIDLYISGSNRSQVAEAVRHQRVQRKTSARRPRHPQTGSCHAVVTKHASE